jgi:metal-responsive CopG/Arc/MetJ family transcriptional regulator
MTIDERLERLAERHEALAQTVELFIAENREAQRENAKKIAALAIIAEQNETRCQEMVQSIRRLDVRTGQMMDAITRLASIAGAHEERIGRLENR